MSISNYTYNGNKFLERIPDLLGILPHKKNPL